VNEPPSKTPRKSLPAQWKASKPSKQARTGLIAAAAAAVILLVLLLALGGEDSSDGSSDSSSAPPVSEKATLVSESDLQGTIEGVDYPVYWVGPRAGVSYEVQRPEADRTFVRYLPEGEEVESEVPFLTVGSYQKSEALQAIEELGAKGGILIKIAGGGSAYAEGPQATSAYVAFPGVETQIEVYDPQAGAALALARSGAIVPIG
jgi:hypothetical protein